MARLLYQALSREIAPDYVRRLLAAFPSSEPKQATLPIAKPDHVELVEPLSDRELEVLQLIAEGLTNPAIASRLFLSVNTVKPTPAISTANSVPIAEHKQLPRRKFWGSCPPSNHSDA